ncbi:uncharacterized protein LACBIDRAFT_332936 [Laccaria bicolor S238N-H82]|uniref:Predicted protein n=1 Tax=Laccaria bicolor (strain S238N-H82 / ATCC MYA-4686) TaxID=486041 RepID=B0DUB9_LACBS|nr:uncharacterized protein LACBIDRAFT_332936 [Laccaria bicolor S238N-H82]EDR01775.1 predicted protein [Laccaria bicolor S238N-H82]|eukprot:XP_001887588.1 predicted protein [Laccaria bicolor S238N-H82]
MVYRQARPVFGPEDTSFGSACSTTQQPEPSRNYLSKIKASPCFRFISGSVICLKRWEDPVSQKETAVLLTDLKSGAKIAVIKGQFQQVVSDRRAEALNLKLYNAVAGAATNSQYCGLQNDMALMSGGAIIKAVQARISPGQILSI